MTRLRIAVIGAGNIAQQHLPVLTSHPACEVAVLCDVDPATLAETAQRFGIATQATILDAVLRRDDLDAAFVLVSVLQVASVAGACIAAGLPTFLEKPPGLYSADTARLAELADRHGTIAMVGLNRRFYASHLDVKAFLSGWAPRPHWVGTPLVTPERRAAAGPIATVTVEAHEDLARISRQKFPPVVLRRWAYANGLHALDLLRFFGGDVVEVESHRAQVEHGFPDSFTAYLRFAGGATGRAAIDWMAPGRHRFEVRAVGVRATSEPGFGATEVAVRGQPPATIAPDEDDRRYKPGFWKQDSAFLAAVGAGRQPPWPAPSLADAHATMVMIDQICGFPAAEADER